jgi:hypothetical protein
MRLIAIAAALLGLVAPLPVLAHPHMWISQVVRVVAKDGQFTHVELEWRFDPYASELEIPLIDEDKNGSFSRKEIELLGKDMMPEMKKFGYMTWLNLGGADVRPPKAPVFNARIDDPASFTLPDWDRSAGDGAGGTRPMPPNKTVQPADPKAGKPRNLVYIMRFELPKPAKAFTVTSFDQDDFIRIEVDKNALPAGCKLAKHATYKAEYIRGYPVFADTVSCQLP